MFSTVADNCHGKTKRYGTTNFTHGRTKLTLGKTKKTSWSAIGICIPNGMSCNSNTLLAQKKHFSSSRCFAPRVTFLYKERFNFISSPQCKYMNFIYLKSSFITWMVYLDPTHWPAPSWLVNSVGRALLRYCRGHGFKSRTGLNFFQVLFSTTRFRSVLSCEDLLISSLHRNANIWISYI